MVDDEPFTDTPAVLEVIDRESLAEGRIISLVRESFDYNGVHTAREFVVHPGAVAVIAMDDDGRVLLIKQYRHPIRTRAWEAPAGLLDLLGEPLLEAAQRELAEEADLAADEWSFLLDLTTASGSSNEVVRVYLARGLRTVETTFVREAEEADMELRWTPLAEVVQAALDGRIRNSLLVAGVLAVAAREAIASTS